jgi:hypothetical protein
VQEDISASPVALAAAAATAKARVKAKQQRKQQEAQCAPASHHPVQLHLPVLCSGQQLLLAAVQALPLARQHPLSPQPPADLAELLSNLKLTKYNAAFEENEVDIDAVKLMSKADFSELWKPH